MLILLLCILYNRFWYTRGRFERILAVHECTHTNTHRYMHIHSRWQSPGAQAAETDGIYIYIYMQCSHTAEVYIQLRALGVYSWLSTQTDQTKKNHLRARWYTAGAPSSYTAKMNSDRGPILSARAAIECSNMGFVYHTDSHAHTIIIK